MKNARSINLLTGATGVGLVGGGLALGDTSGIVMAIVGAIFSLIAGNVPPDPPPPTSARDMARRSGVLLVLAVFLAACSGPPGPPVHISTTVEIDGAELDATTRWKVCASERHCVFVDVGLLWSEEGRVACLELPQYAGVLTCHPIGGEDAEE